MDSVKDPSKECHDSKMQGTSSTVIEETASAEVKQTVSAEVKETVSAVEKIDLTVQDTVSAVTETPSYSCVYPNCKKCKEIHVKSFDTTVKDAASVEKTLSASKETASEVEETVSALVKETISAVEEIDLTVQDTVSTVKESTLSVESKSKIPILEIETKEPITLGKQCTENKIKSTVNANSNTDTKQASNQVNVIGTKAQVTPKATSSLPVRVPNQTIVRYIGEEKTIIVGIPPSKSTDQQLRPSLEIRPSSTIPHRPRYPIIYPSYNWKSSTTTPSPCPIPISCLSVRPPTALNPTINSNSSPKNIYFVPRTYAPYKKPLPQPKPTQTVGFKEVYMPPVPPFQYIPTTNLQDVTKTNIIVSTQKNSTNLQDVTNTNNIVSTQKNSTNLQVVTKTNNIAPTRQNSANLQVVTKTNNISPIRQNSTNLQVVTNTNNITPTQQNSTNLQNVTNTYYVVPIPTQQNSTVVDSAAVEKQIERLRPTSENMLESVCAFCEAKFQGGRNRVSKTKFTSKLRTNKYATNGTDAFKVVIGGPEYTTKEQELFKERALCGNCSGSLGKANEAIKDLLSRAKESSLFTYFYDRRNNAIRNDKSTHSIETQTESSFRFETFTQTDIPGIDAGVQTKITQEKMNMYEKTVNDSKRNSGKTAIIQAAFKRLDPAALKSFRRQINLEMIEWGKVTHLGRPLEPAHPFPKKEVLLAELTQYAPLTLNCLKALCHHKMNNKSFTQGMCTVICVAAAQQSQRLNLFQKAIAYVLDLAFHSTIRRAHVFQILGDHSLSSSYKTVRRKEVTNQEQDSTADAENNNNESVQPIPPTPAPIPANQWRVRLRNETCSNCIIEPKQIFPFYRHAPECKQVQNPGKLYEVVKIMLRLSDHQFPLFYANTINRTRSDKERKYDEGFCYTCAVGITLTYHKMKEFNELTAEDSFISALKERRDSKLTNQSSETLSLEVEVGNLTGFSSFCCNCHASLGKSQKDQFYLSGAISRFKQACTRTETLGYALCYVLNLTEEDLNDVEKAVGRPPIMCRKCAYLIAMGFQRLFTFNTSTSPESFIYEIQNQLEKVDFNEEEILEYGKVERELFPSEAEIHLKNLLTQKRWRYTGPSPKLTPTSSKPQEDIQSDQANDRIVAVSDSHSSSDENSNEPIVLAELERKILPLVNEDTETEKSKKGSKKRIIKNRTPTPCPSPSPDIVFIPTSEVEDIQVYEVNALVVPGGSSSVNTDTNSEEAIVILPETKSTSLQLGKRESLRRHVPRLLKKRKLDTGSSGSQSK